MWRGFLGVGLALALTTGAIAAPFAKADVNHDGLVSYQDAKRVLPLLSQVSFDKFDFNSDGLLDRREWSGLDNFYTVLYRER